MNTVATFTKETEQEVDCRWIANIVEIPSAMSYCPTQDQAIVKGQGITLHVNAPRLESREG